MSDGLRLLLLVFDSVVIHDRPRCGLSHDRRTAFVSADALADERALNAVATRLVQQLPDKPDDER